MADGSGSAMASTPMPEWLQAVDVEAEGSAGGVWARPTDHEAFESLARVVARAAVRGRDGGGDDERTGEREDEGAVDDVNTAAAAAAPPTHGAAGNASKSAWERAERMQGQMRRCEQRREDFDDADALWGYVGTKFAQRAALAHHALWHGAPRALSDALRQPDLRVAAMGGGPAAELMAVAVARELLTGGAPAGLAVCEWVGSWQPMVDAVARTLRKPIEYHICDITKPLDAPENVEFQRVAGTFDVLIFSYVILECSKHGDALALLRDVWRACPRVRHVLVLDAGQARGRGRRDRPLAGSLRAVAELADTELGGPAAVRVTRVEGRRVTDGVLLARVSEGERCPQSRE